MRNNNQSLLPIMHNTHSVAWIMSVVRVCNPSFHSLTMCISSCVHGLALASLPLLGRPKFKTFRVLYQNITHQSSQPFEFEMEEKFRPCNVCDTCCSCHCMCILNKWQQQLAWRLITLLIKPRRVREGISSLLRLHSLLGFVEYHMQLQL